MLLNNGRHPYTNETIFPEDWTNTSKWNGYMEKKGWHLKMDFGERRGLILVRLVGLERIARRCGLKGSVIYINYKQSNASI